MNLDILTVHALMDSMRNFVISVLEPWYFNCSCPNEFHGKTCDVKRKNYIIFQVTTMSLNGTSQILVNTTRDEGYDIQFRFKTTLRSGLLAIGKGATYYILELANGKLNLHSSLLNKWEGVFIGSNLTNSKWQRVSTNIWPGLCYYPFIVMLRCVFLLSYTN